MNAQRLAAVLWDMDGTLVDTEPLWLRAQQAMLERYRLTMTPALHHSLIGSGLWDAAVRFQQFGVPLSADDIVAEQVAGVLSGIQADGVIWRPGARELLSSLQAAQIPCALVTMSTRLLADAVIARLPAGSFAAVVAGDEVQHEKPHPDPYIRGARALSVDIFNCLALEDSPTGLRSATAAGAVAIGIPNLLDLDAAPAHARVASLQEFDATSLAARFATLRTQDPRPSASILEQPL